jgi:hypothetical protein
MKHNLTIRPIVAKHWLPVLIIVGLVLIGYYKVFLGANFFTEEDPVTLYKYAHGNSMGNGWRPDKGFGTSFFFGDPGAFHSWSLFSFWERLFSTPYRAYNISILTLLILAALSQYVFLVNVVPRIGNLACLFSPLIVFGPLQYEFFFQRHWITLSIGTPLLLLLLDDFFKESKTIHYVAGSLLFWFVLFFGSLAALQELIIVGGIFTVAYSVYHDRPFITAIRKSGILFFLSGASTLLLGAWAFYSIILESRIVDYVRAPNYLSETSVSLTSLAQFFLGFLHSTWFPPVPMARPPSLEQTSWTNCSPWIPVVMIAVIFRRSRTQWQALLKTLWIAFVVNEFMFVAIPDYAKLLIVVARLYPLSKFQPAYHCFEIALLAGYVVEVRDTGFFKSSGWVSRLQRLAGLALFVFYSLLGLAVVILIFDYAQVAALLRATIERSFPDNLFGYSKPFITEVVLFILGQAHAVSGWMALSFYALTAFLVLIFSRPAWLFHIIGRSKTGIGMFVVLDAFLFSWFVFPLNDRPLVWSNQASSEALKTLSFQPTDRFYRFVDPAQTNEALGSVERFRNTWVNVDAKSGRRESLSGYLDTPGLNLSGTTSYAPRETVDFALAAFNSDDERRISNMRSVEVGPLHNSELLNMAAVSYYFTEDSVTVQPPLQPFSHAKQLYVYKNTAAWPYFYLADQLQVAGKTPFQQVKRYTAYVSPQDYFDLTPPTQHDSVGLTKFSYGDMQFHYAGDHEQFLVVADSWHPFWKVAIDGMPATVVKANWIFKGVRLPMGNHGVRFYFDPSPYYVGIYISAAAWIILIVLLIRLNPLTVTTHEMRSQGDCAHPGR